MRYLRGMRPTMIVLLSLVVVGFLSRVLPHPLNFTPIIAMTLLASTYARPRWLGILVPFAAMLLSDFVLYNTVYAGMLAEMSVLDFSGVYLAIGLCALVPLVLRASSGSSMTKLALTGVSGAFVFFFSTNFMVWLTSGMYVKNVAGLLTCYAAGLPFFLNSLLSTLLFGALGVVVMKLAEARFGRVQEVLA
jgi:hypothetical protein